MITLGQVIAYGIGAGFSNVNHGWRWMVGLGAVPAAMQILFLFFLPESRAYLFSIRLQRHFSTRSLSARILLRRGDKAAAHAIMKKIYAFAKPEEVDLKVSAEKYIAVTRHAF